MILSRHKLALICITAIGLSLFFSNDEQTPPVIAMERPYDLTEMSSVVFEASASVSDENIPNTLNYEWSILTITGNNELFNLVNEGQKATLHIGNVKQSESFVVTLVVTDQNGKTAIKNMAYQVDDNNVASGITSRVI